MNLPLIYSLHCKGSSNLEYKWFFCILFNNSTRCLWNDIFYLLRRRTFSLSLSSWALSRELKCKYLLILESALLTNIASDCVVISFDHSGLLILTKHCCLTTLIIWIYRGRSWPTNCESHSTEQAKLVASWVFYPHTYLAIIITHTETEPLLDIGIILHRGGKDTLGRRRWLCELNTFLSQRLFKIRTCWNFHSETLGHLRFLCEISQFFFSFLVQSARNYDVRLDVKDNSAQSEERSPKKCSKKNHVIIKAWNMTTFTRRFREAK